MTGGWIEVDAGAGESFSCYVAGPPAMQGAGIVMLQEIFGVTPALCEVADRFASEGFLVAVPDLYWRMQRRVSLGYDGAGREQAHDYLARFDEEAALRDTAGVAEALRAMPECSGRVAVVGYCLGGTLAYLCAARLAIDAAVGYYGTDIHNRLQEAAHLRCPLLLHFAERDHLMNAGALAQVRRALNGADAAIQVHPGVGHAFCRYVEPAEAAERDAAAAANARTWTFLRRQETRAQPQAARP